MEKRSENIKRVFTDGELKNPVTKESYIEAMENAQRFEDSLELEPLEKFLKETQKNANRSL